MSSRSKKVVIKVRGHPAFENGREITFTIQRPEELQQALNLYMQGIGVDMRRFKTLLGVPTRKMSNIRRKTLQYGDVLQQLRDHDAKMTREKEWHIKVVPYDDWERLFDSFIEMFSSTRPFDPQPWYQNGRTCQRLRSEKKWKKYDDKCSTKAICEDGAAWGNIRCEEFEGNYRIVEIQSREVCQVVDGQLVLTNMPRTVESITFAGSDPNSLFLNDIGYLPDLTELYFPEIDQRELNSETQQILNRWGFRDRRKRVIFKNGESYRFQHEPVSFGASSPGSRASSGVYHEPPFPVDTVHPPSWQSIHSPQPIHPSSRMVSPHRSERVYGSIQAVDPLGYGAYQSPLRPRLSVYRPDGSLRVSSMTTSEDGSGDSSETRSPPSDPASSSSSDGDSQPLDNTSNVSNNEINVMAVIIAASILSLGFLFLVLYICRLRKIRRRNQTATRERWSTLSTSVSALKLEYQ